MGTRRPRQLGKGLGRGEDGRAHLVRAYTGEASLETGMAQLLLTGLCNLCLPLCSCCPLCCSLSQTQARHKWHVQGTSPSLQSMAKSWGPVLVSTLQASWSTGIEGLSKLDGSQYLPISQQQLAIKMQLLVRFHKCIQHEPLNHM